MHVGSSWHQCAVVALWLGILTTAFAFSAVHSPAPSDARLPGRKGIWYWYNQYKYKNQQPIARRTYKFIRPPPTQQGAFNDPYLRQQVQGYERLVMGKRAWNKVKQAEIEEQHSLKGDQDADGVDDINWVNGIISKITRQGVHVDLSSGMGRGIIPLDELSIEPHPVIHDVTPLGSVVTCEHIATKNRTAILSLKRPLLRRIWQKMHEFRRKNMVTKGIIVKALLTGIVVRFWGFHAVIPKNDYQGYLGREAIGKVINFRFRYVHWNEQRIIGSHRKALLSIHKDEFKLGDMIPVAVERITPHGVVCNAKYGIHAFLPITQVSHYYTRDLHKIFKEGQTIYAVIVDPNLEKGDLMISTKFLEPNPGDMLTNPKMVFKKAPELASVLIPPVLREMQRRQLEKAAHKAAHAGRFSH